MSNGCPQTAALERIAKVLEAMEAPGGGGAPSIIERFARAADELADLGGAQKKLCAFIVGNRLKISAAIIGLLVAVGAISPSAGEALQNVFKAAGLL